MKRYVIAVVAVLLAVVLVLLLWDRSAAKVQEHLQAAQGELQIKRAIALSEDSLKKLKRIDLAIAMTAADIERLEPSLKAALNTSKSAKEKGLQFDDVQIELGDQSLSVAASVEIPVRDIKVKATIFASAAVGAASNGLHWNLYFDGIRVDDVDGPGRLDDVAAKSLAGQLLLLKPVINAVLDEAVNDSPSTAMLLPLGHSGLLPENLSDLSDDDVTFDEKPLNAILTADATGVIIDRQGILVVADVSIANVLDPDALGPVFPADSSLVLQPSDKVSDRIARYRTALQALVASQHGKTLDPLTQRTASGAAIAREAVARVFNLQFEEDGITAAVAIHQPSSSSRPVTFKIQEKDCSKYFDACHYRDVCEGDRCEQKVNRTVTEECNRECCLISGGLGCVLKGLCKHTCDRIVSEVLPITSAHCVAFRETNKLYANKLCEAVSNSDKAICDAHAVGRKFVCSSVQEVRRFYEKHPIATVTTTMTPDATVHATLTDALWAPDMSKLNATLAATGSGKVKAGISYNRHNYTGGAVLAPDLDLGLGCKVDWAESVTVDVDATLGSVPVEFTMSPSVMKDGVLRLQFTQAAPVMAHADFNPGPLVALFAGKPQVTLNCPFAAVASVVFGAGEAVFTQEDARTIFPLLTGKNYPIELKDKTFKVDIKPIEVCETKAKCDVPLMTLMPTLEGKVVRFVAAAPP